MTEGLRAPVKRLRTVPRLAAAPGWTAAPESRRGSRVSETLDRLVPAPVRAWIVPVAMVAVLVVGLVLSVLRIGLLLDWPEQHSGAGTHVVTSCATGEVSGGPVWVCEGALVADGSTADVRSELVTSREALASHQPYVGQRTEVFFDPSERGTAHPVVFRLNELTRLYLSLLPRLLMMGGAAIWLAGWLLTRRFDADDLVVADRVVLPGRFQWRARGWRWLAVGGLVVVVNAVLTARVLGSLGTF